jgi:hypothetical protein
MYVGLQSDRAIQVHARRCTFEGNADVSGMHLGLQSDRGLCRVFSGSCIAGGQLVFILVVATNNTALGLQSSMFCASPEVGAKLWCPTIDGSCLHGLKSVFFNHDL